MQPILIGGAILIAAYFLWKLVTKDEQRTRSHMEEFVEEQVARYLSQEVKQPLSDVRLKLASDQAPVEFKNQYAAAIASVNLVFRRRENSYEVETRIRPSSGSEFSAKKKLAYDDLPNKVQEGFLRGETELQLEWQPVFIA